MSNRKVTRLDRAIEELALLRNDLRRKWCQTNNDALKETILDSEHRICHALTILEKEKARQDKRAQPVPCRVLEHIDIKGVGE